MRHHRLPRICRPHDRKLIETTFAVDALLAEGLHDLPRDLRVREIRRSNREPGNVLGREWIAKLWYGRVDLPLDILERQTHLHAALVDFLGRGVARRGLGEHHDPCADLSGRGNPQHALPEHGGKRCLLAVDCNDCVGHVRGSWLLQWGLQVHHHLRIAFFKCGFSTTSANGGKPASNFRFPGRRNQTSVQNRYGSVVVPRPARTLLLLTHAGADPYRVSPIAAQGLPLMPSQRFRGVLIIWYAQRIIVARELGLWLNSGSEVDTTSPPREAIKNVLQLARTTDIESAGRACDLC